MITFFRWQQGYHRNNPLGNLKLDNVNEYYYYYY